MTTAIAICIFVILDVAAYFAVEPRKRRKFWFMPPGGGFAALIIHGRKQQALTPLARQSWSRDKGGVMPYSDCQEVFIGTIHKAGPMVGAVQKCLDCGGTLCDYTNAMVQVGHELPGGWEDGADVTYWGSLTGSNQSAVGIHHPAIRCKQPTA